MLLGEGQEQTTRTGNNAKLLVTRLSEDKAAATGGRALVQSSREKSFRAVLGCNDSARAQIKLTPKKLRSKWSRTGPWAEAAKAIGGGVKQVGAALPLQSN